MSNGFMIFLNVIGVLVFSTIHFASFLKWMETRNYIWFVPGIITAIGCLFCILFVLARLGLIELIGV